MMPARRPGALAVGTGTSVTLALTAILLWPALGRGELLYRDFVAVPEPSVTARTFGLGEAAPRAVPLDLVTALLDPVIPSGVQQQVMLLATCLLAGTGVSFLLRRRGPAAAAFGAALATWSPYAVERLLVGQPPTLLAVSCLPWLVLVARDVRGTRRYLLLTLVAALPAALTPFGGALALAASVVCALLLRRASRATVAGAVLLGLAWCSPWLVAAAVGRTEAGQEAGARAFALRMDGPIGLLDVLGGGGVWAAAAVPASRATMAALAASTLVVVAAVGGLLALRDRRGVFALAGLALVAPVGLALLATTPPGLALTGAAQAVPGMGLLRDTHRIVGVSATALAVLAPIGLQRLTLAAGRASSGGAPRVVAVSLGVVGVAAAVLSVPDAPGLLHAAYRPVAYPAGWQRMVDVVGDRHALLLPWQPLRQTVWAREVPFLDTAPLALRGEVTHAQTLTVRRDGELLTVGPPEPAAAARWSTGRLAPDDLRAASIEMVVEWRGTLGPPVAAHPGLELVLDSPELRVWRVPAA